VWEIIQKLLGKTTWDGSERRRTVRWRTVLEMIVAPSGDSARLRDLSHQGARLELASPPQSKLNRLKIAPAQFPDQLQDCKIRWQSGRQIGVQFHTPLRASWVTETMPATAAQQRRHLRVRTDWTVQAHDGRRGLEVRIRDLSIGGCRFQTRTALEVGQTLRLHMGKILVSAVVCRLTPSEPGYLVGVSFLADQLQTQQLIDLLKKLSGA
jgi:hypothetical protein